MNEVNKNLHCDTCHKVFGTNTRKREYRRRIVDPVTNTVLIVCNACGLLLKRWYARWNRDRNTEEQAKASPADSAYSWKDIGSFVTALQTALNDDSVDRLYCPVVTPKVCSCIQRYVTDPPKSNSLGLTNSCEDLINKTKAVELYELHKQAKELAKMKMPLPKNKKLSLNEIRGVIHLRTKEYEDFVLQNRVNLKRNYHMCERAVQRVLCYSNNYLHKQLKTLPNRKARITGKIALAAEHLPDIKTVGYSKCCRHKCTQLALTHERLIEKWRCKFLLGWKDARTVLGEMLMPAGGGVFNCFKFIQLVTGCTETFYRRVKRDIKKNGFVRAAHEHELRDYWRCKKSETVSNHNSNANRHATQPSVITRNVNITKDKVLLNGPVMSEPTFNNGVASLDDRNEMPLITSNSVSVINSTKNAINTDGQNNMAKEILDNGLNEVVPSLLSNIGYIESYSDEIHDGCLENNSGALLTLDLLPPSDGVCSVRGMEESVDKIQMLPSVLTTSNVTSAIQVVPPNGNDCDGRTLDASDSNEGDVQYIEITKISDLPVVRQNGEDSFKYVYMIAPDCLLLS